MRWDNKDANTHDPLHMFGDYMAPDDVIGDNVVISR
jgi:hypothetical protein